MSKINRNRRGFFKKLGLVLASLPFSFSGIAAIFTGTKEALSYKGQNGSGFNSDFSNINDRVWIGEQYWAIPMEDWQVRKGRLEFTGADRFSRVNLLTSEIREGDGEVIIAVDLGLIEKKNNSKSGSAGFSIGISDEVDPDVKAACYYGKGINAGVSTTGKLFIDDNIISLPQNFDYSNFQLSVKAKSLNNTTNLTLSCKGSDGSLTEISYQVDKDIPGLIALVNNFNEKNGSHFWFNNINITGSKAGSKPDNSFGPVLWAMYTLSKGTLKITAQMPPLGKKDNKAVSLLLKNGNEWEKISSENIDEAAYIAEFIINGRDSKKEIPYRLVYENDGTAYNYDGTIRKEPLNRPLRFGGLTCQHANGYPYSPLIKNLKKHDPDMLYFSGDQLYEQNGGYPIKRQPEPDAILSYLGKWYMFGWAFGDVMRNRPTICTPDDHDVFQGNLWGEGGEGIPFEEWEKKKDGNGGYVQTPKMINVVHRTQCSHMPSAFHNEPLESGITTWYTDLVYGRVSFAVISDRMFKSGPEQVREESNGQRRDHIAVPLKENELESPDLKLLGARQMEFLEHWVNDWNGADMKVLLSQTIFCNPATHHGPKKMFLHGDLDSGGWPTQKRDDVLRLIRKGFVFHINGDQHLPFLLQYGIDKAQDAGWAFCTPAISVGYPRWAEPDSVGKKFKNRPSHGLPNTGAYRDGFGNDNYIYAVGNPEDKPRGKNRYVTAQNKGSGFGIITFNTEERTITMEAFRFLADKDNPSDNDIFPGWPLTILQTDNDGRKATAYLPRLEMTKPDQVVKIINEDRVVNILRIKGSDYQPKVYEEGSYTVVVGEGKLSQTFKGVKAAKKLSNRSISISI
jgi:alkaline phosphatase D